MMSSPVRRIRLLAALLLATAGAGPLLPPDASAAEEVVAIRGVPSSLSSRYGTAVPLDALSPGHYLVPSWAGFEIRIASHASNDSLVATFRGAGPMTEAALLGSTAWLAAGSQGLLAADLSTLAAPVAAGSYGSIGTIRHVAAAPASQALAAASDSTLHFFRETAPGSLSWLQSRRYSDGRRIRRIAARNDSFLVASDRIAPTLRIFLTLYRARTGADPESLWEFQANGHQALDLAWPGGIAFLADENRGILPFELATRQLRPATPLSGNRYVSALDANDSLVMVLVGDRVFARLTRTGSLGDQLVNERDYLLTLQAASEVGLVGAHAIISTASENQPPEPDEIGRSAIEDHDLATEVTAPPVGATGRVRRVVHDRGYAFVADYTGGLRIHRAAGPDTSLIGVLPPLPTGRCYDVGLDGQRRLAYLASGATGLEVVDVSDPAAPARITSVGGFGGTVRCVAAIDTELVAVGWTAVPGPSGITFVDVRNPVAPVPLGTASIGPAGNPTVILDPNSVAVLDTTAFLADGIGGLISVGFGDPAAPVIVGPASGYGASDVSLSGFTLLLATHARGVQVVDVSAPAIPVLRSEIPLPSVYGVAQQGAVAVAFTGEEGAVVIDLPSLAFPRNRGSIRPPGFARDGTWTGDTLLIAASYGLERFVVGQTPAPSPPLALQFDAEAAIPRVEATWPPVTVSGAAAVVGLNLYRETLAAAPGAVTGSVRRINGPMLPPLALGAGDSTITPGTSYRYRLEAYLADGSTREVAEGSISIGSLTRAGRPYPNPFRPAAGASLSIPFVSQVAGGSSGTARARIYDARGRLVRTLTAQAPAAGGFGTLAWDGRDARGVPASSGIYYIQLRAPGLEESRRAVLLR